MFNRKFWLIGAVVLAVTVGAPEFVLAETDPVVSEDTRILAAVGKDVVTSNDLERHYEMFIKANNITPKDAEEEHGIKLEVLRSLVDEKIIIQEAKRLDIRVSDEEIDRAIAHIEEGQSMPSGSLIQQNEALGISAAELRKQIHSKLVLEKILFDVVFANPNNVIHDSEVNEVIGKDHPERLKVKAFVLKYSDSSITKRLRKLDKTSLSDIGAVTAAAGIAPTVINSSLNGIKDNKVRQMVASAKEEPGLLVYQHGDQAIAVILCEKNSSMSKKEFEDLKETLRNKKLDTHAKHYLADLRKKKAVDIHVDENF